MKFIRIFHCFRSRRFLVYAASFLVAGAVFVLSDAILKQNSLKITGEGDHKEGEYGTLVNWLPKDAKIAIEYRARSLYLQNRMRRTKNPDMRVRAVYEFGDYIRQRDPRGSDSVFASIVDRKEFSSSRYAYLGFGELLLDKQSSRPVSIEELHACIRRLRWPEDLFYAWEHVQKKVNSRRLNWEQKCQVYSLLLENLPKFRNFERFFNELSRAAGKCGKTELQKQAEARKAEYKKLPWMPGGLLKAPVTYRENYANYENDLKKAKTDEEKIRALTGLGHLARGVDEVTSLKFFHEVLDNPSYASNTEAYQTYAYMLLYSRSPRKVSIARYHQLLDSIDKDEILYMAWEAGFRQLLQNKNSDKVQLEYLRPLVSLKKEYVEYADLFRRLEQLTFGNGQEELSKKASDFLVRVQETEMPSLFNRDQYMFGREF